LSVLIASNIQKPFMHRPYERNTRERLSKCCIGKAISITYSECVSVALVIQYEMRKLTSVACSAVQYFSTLSHKRHDLLINVTEYKTCGLIFSMTFVSKISNSMKN